MGNSTNLGLFFEISVALFWISVSSSVRLPIPSNSEPLVLLMMEDRSRADVATLRRHDVETSRRCCLMTFSLVDPTSRCWNVTTWERRDVGTSRRSSTFMHCFPLLHFASKVCSFHFLFTCTHRNCHTQVSGYKKHIFKCKITLKA